VGKCNEFQCFEAKMNYEMPVVQMKKLIALSGSCVQRIDFKCKLAPLKSRDGDDLFSWTDAQGIQHSLPGSNCNQNDPIWKKDSIEVTDMAMLPIQKINYGPLVEPEEAKVVVSAITCKPPQIETWPEHTIEGQINNLRTEQAEFSTKLTKPEADRVITTTLKPLPTQCNQYKSLTDVKRRNDQLDYTSDKCDKVGPYKFPDWKGEQWYRVEGGAGSKISKDYGNWKWKYCGTDHGGHMLGGLPVTVGPQQYSSTDSWLFIPCTSELF